MSGHKVGTPLNRGTYKSVRTGLGAKIHDSRIKSRMTQAAVGDLVKMSAKQIQHIETGIRSVSREELDQFAQIFDWDEMPAPERLPLKESPVPVTHGLRKAVTELKREGFGGTDKQLEQLVSETPSVAEILGEEDFSLRRLLKSAQYVSENMAKLVTQYESTLREIHRLEQRMSGGLTVEQIDVLRDKARRWDDLQEIMARKSRA